MLKYENASTSVIFSSSFFTVVICLSHFLDLLFVSLPDIYIIGHNPEHVKILIKIFSEYFSAVSQVAIYYDFTEKKKPPPDSRWR